MRPGSCTASALPRAAEIGAEAAVFDEAARLIAVANVVDGMLIPGKVLAAG